MNPGQEKIQAARGTPMFNKAKELASDIRTYRVRVKAVRAQIYFPEVIEVYDLAQQAFDEIHAWFERGDQDEEMVAFLFLPALQGVFLLFGELEKRLAQEGSEVAKRMLRALVEVRERLAAMPDLTVDPGTYVEFGGVLDV
jgi:hypothetical protein